MERHWIGMLPLVFSSGTMAYQIFYSSKDFPLSLAFPAHDVWGNTVASTTDWHWDTQGGGMGKMWGVSQWYIAGSTPS